MKPKKKKFIISQNDVLSGIRRKMPPPVIKFNSKKTKNKRNKVDHDE